MENIFFKLIIFASFLVENIYGKEDAEAKILKYTNNQDGGGNYEFSFITSNGIERSEVGTIKKNGDLNEFFIVKGSYSYIAPDRSLITMYYVADENGYRVSDKPPAPVPQRPIVDTLVNPAVVASLLGR